MATPLNQKQAITNLQRYLRRVSFEKDAENRVPVDGIFDSVTREALMDFQADEGLPVTGIADRQTWDALFDRYTYLTRNELTAQGLYPFPKNPPDYAVSAGDTLLLVSIIQLLLLELRAVYDIFEDVAQSGTYDAQTQEAIRKFQQINGLDATGEVDEVTWNAIVREYSNLESRESS